MSLRGIEVLEQGRKQGLVDREHPHLATHVLDRDVHGQNVAGVFRVGFYLSSDISDVDVRCADLTVELSIPKMFYDLLAAIDPDGMGCERLENLELCSGEALLRRVDTPT